MKNLIPCTLLALLLSLFACKKGDSLSVMEIPNTNEDELTASYYSNLQKFDFQSNLPNYLLAMGLENPVIDNAKADLGRIVFYDKNLSADGLISCASCHKQAYAFADNTAFSKGVNGHFAARNSLSLTNVANFAAHYTNIGGRQPNLLWDGRATDVATQASLAFTNPHEMGLSMDEVVQKASNQPYYRYWMTQAYGDKEVTETRLLEGVQEFVRSMGSAKSKLDMALEKVNGDLFGTTRDTILAAYYGTTTIRIESLMNFTPSELNGRTLFAKNCTKCHSPIRTAQEEFMACNGLDRQYADKGLGAISGRPEDEGVFKSPSLRNIALTAPYMHDGRFATLESVVDFYSNGIQKHPNLHPSLRNNFGLPQYMNFTEEEKKDLIAFLHTMTSADVKTDKRFSDPFYK